jgi:hypothetical protein
MQEKDGTKKRMKQLLDLVEQVFFTLELLLMVFFPLVLFKRNWVLSAFMANLDYV